ncbi:hypothetical protein DXG01_015915 [Tephrocybe rancida]|nr:hypothetical protein DXG01_015915 [Tephrocybe rancida]
MDHDDHVLNLSDVVHDETIDDDDNIDSTPSPRNAHRSPSPSPFDSDLHEPYSGSAHAQLASDNISIDTLEREIASLLSENASAASAALLTAAAQQRQANMALGSNGGVGNDEHGDGIAGLGLGLSGLAAVLQVAHARAAENERVAEEMAAKDPEYARQREAAISGKEQQTTRTAPAFHSLTAGEASPLPHRSRRRGETRGGSQGSDYLFTDRDSGSDREDLDMDRHGESLMTPDSSRARPGTPPRSSPPVTGEFSDINDILNQLSAQFEPGPAHGHGHDISTPDSSPVVSHVHAHLTEADSHLIPSPAPDIPSTTHPAVPQPVASTSAAPNAPTELLRKSPKKLKDKEKGPNVHTCKRPYKCEDPTCEKTFTRRTTLTTHMRTHDPHWEPDPNVKYNFKGKKRRMNDDDDDDQDLAESVRTISALFQAGGNAMQPASADEPLEVRVASISAEIAAAIAKAQSRRYPDDDEDEEDDEESGSGQEIDGPEIICPNTSGIRGLDIGDVRTVEKDERQRLVEEDDDSDAFPVPLRTRKGKDSPVAGTKRKR